MILSPNEFSGKYVKFNRLVEMTTKVPWEEPLKESAKIALSSPSVRYVCLIKDGVNDPFSRIYFTVKF